MGKLTVALPKLGSRRTSSRKSVAHENRGSVTCRNNEAFLPRAESKKRTHKVWRKGGWRKKTLKVLDELTSTPCAEILPQNGRQDFRQ